MVRPRNNALKDFQLIPLKMTESWNDTQPQIAAAEPTAGTESIDNFVDQPDETDMTQFAIETELELDTVQALHNRHICVIRKHSSVR